MDYRADTIEDIIYQGDDYLGARQLAWSKKNYPGPSLVAAQAVCHFMTLNDYLNNVSAVSAFNVVATVGTVIETDGTITATWSVPLTAAQTATMSGSPPADPNNWVAQVITTTGDGHVQTDFDVSLTVKRRISLTAFLPPPGGGLGP